MAQNINEIHFNIFTAVKISADENIRYIEPIKRNCYFSDETEIISLHKNYSNFNCIFECLLSSAQEELMRRNGSKTTCTPWNFPFLDDNHRKCNPWEAVDIKRYMGNLTIETHCSSLCLPDCNKIFYKSKVTTEPIRNCDEKNFGVSSLCFTGRKSVQPTLWSKAFVNKEPFVIDGWWRTDQIQNVRMFPTLDRSYGAFEEDIAVLNVFFESSTAIEFQNQAAMNWYTYLANVGGVLGLCVGVSIMSIFELVWLALRLSQLLLPNILKLSKTCKGRIQDCKKRRSDQEEIEEN